jgi:CO/xanthine dehydrogenase FAD-binding subunit
VGSASAVARRLPDLEALLKGRKIDASLASVVEPPHFDSLEPISDVRGTAEYRRDAAVELVRRAIAELAVAS